MKQLYENKLIFGGLLTIDDPNMIGRYNKALKGFGLKTVELDSFQIDMTGYSPEVAKALGDEQYLDPNGVNRRFVILTPDQIDLPVVHTQFSNTEELMLEFFENNRREIFVVTIKDVLYGEIEDNVLTVDTLDDLLKIEQVEFKLSTADDVLGKAHKLQNMVDRLLKDPDAWQDEEMLASMVEAAKVTGDIRTNELLPKEVVFRHEAFWTSHFGGVYVFNDENQITVIADPKTKGFRKSRPWEVSYIDINDHAQVYRFLLDTRRIEPPRGSWVEQSGLLEQRANMLVVGMMVNRDEDVQLKNISERTLDSWVRKNARDIERDGALPLLKFVVKRSRDWSAIDMHEVRPEHRFLISRASPKHNDWWLTNRLISEYLRFDFVTLFVFNKQSFYSSYRQWPENYRKYVVETIRDTYLKDKRALRARYYG